jgi:hypothetical protein
MKNEDTLEKIFELQSEFMQQLVEHDKIPEYPVDLTSKQGQRFVKEIIFSMIEELTEASYTLKNRSHRLTDARLIDIDHYKEEISDALAYFVELCIISGISPIELFELYKQKNKTVKERLNSGY